MASFKNRPLLHRPYRPLVHTSYAWLGLLLLVLSVTCLTKRLQADTIVPQERIVLDDPKTKEIESDIEGIVCDNLKIFAERQPDQRNYLLIRVPEEFSGTGVRPVPSLPKNLALPPGKQLLPGSTGVIQATDKELEWRYYPPDEYDLYPGKKGSVRSIFLDISARMPNGNLITVRPPREIKLGRTTVVLVHGINNNANVWMKRGALGRQLETLGYNLARVNHGKRLDEEKAGPEDVLRFEGNGPGEWGAACLRDTITRALWTRRYTHHLLARRVDIVAHSYGGIISRWYLCTGQQTISQRALQADAKIEGNGSRQWYVNDKQVGSRPRLYTLPQEFTSGQWPQEPLDYAPHPNVRKLITIASQWRGVPAANLINELHVLPEDSAFRQVRIGGLFSVARLEKLLPIPTKVPSMEVLAIDSPWLRFLTQTTSPFLDTVAYKAIAGNHNGYVGVVRHFDTYTTLDYLIPDGSFPYLSLELRQRQRQNYSDGIVPVWTAVFAGQETVVGAAHDTIISNAQAKQYVIDALNNPDLPTGEQLNRSWNDPVRLELRPSSTGQTDAANKTWRFKPKTMAPASQSDIYTQIGGVGRINPAAIGEIRTTKIDHVGINRGRITWGTATRTSGEAYIYQGWRDPGTGVMYYKLRQRLRAWQVSEGGCAGHDADTACPEYEYQSEHFDIPQNDAIYYYRVKSLVENRPDAAIVLRSKMEPIPSNRQITRISYVG